MPNFWHLAHQTPKYEPHEVCHMPKILAHRYNTYETERTTIVKLNIIILLHFSLSSSTYISLSVDSISFLLSLSLSISSLSSLFKKVAQDHSSPRR